MTISGIRPDFIRMSEIYKKLDENFRHILVHTGQHYDELLSGVFFKELNIRKPDYTLDAGSTGTHYHQLGYLSVAIIELIKKEQLKPDLILFLGDANTVSASLALRKEGYVIGHIEAGMRSHDKRMLEELNRTVCDHCSHILFVYHEDYKKNLLNENIRDNVHIVGNTIVEVCKPFIPTVTKRKDLILLDIHRPENFQSKNRMENIIKYAQFCAEKFNLPVKMLKFTRTFNYLKEYNIDTGIIEVIDLLGFKEYLDTVYHCKFIISDSGTAQEEPALCNTPVLIPRDFTERPQSVVNNCSYLLNVQTEMIDEYAFKWIDDIENGHKNINVEWMGAGNTSSLIINHLSNFLI